MPAPGSPIAGARRPIGGMRRLLRRIGAALLVGDEIITAELGHIDRAMANPPRFCDLRRAIEPRDSRHRPGRAGPWRYAPSRAAIGGAVRHHRIYGEHRSGGRRVAAAPPSPPLPTPAADETIGTLRTHKHWSQVGNIFVCYYNKHDWFIGNQAAQSSAGDAARAETPTMLAAGRRNIWSARAATRSSSR